jgi:hypothetical protein
MIDSKAVRESSSGSDDDEDEDEIIRFAVPVEATAHPLVQQQQQQQQMSLSNEDLVWVAFSQLLQNVVKSSGFEVLASGKDLPAEFGPGDESWGSLVGLDPDLRALVVGAVTGASSQLLQELSEVGTVLTASGLRLVDASRRQLLLHQPGVARSDLADLPRLVPARGSDHCYPNTLESKPGTAASADAEGVASSLSAGFAAGVAAFSQLPSYWSGSSGGGEARSDNVEEAVAVDSERVTDHVSKRLIALTTSAWAAFGGGGGAGSDSDYDS